MKTTLKTHPIWQNLTQALSEIEPNQIARQHLQDCKAEIQGYWDENDQYYEAIRFKQSPIPKLISSSLGVTPNQPETSYWLQFRYELTIPPSSTVGELLLILDENLAVIDENWVIDVHSSNVDAITEPT